MKWIKRFLFLVAVILTLVIIAASVGTYMYRAKPSWYRQSTLSPAQKKETGNRAVQKFADVFSWAASVQAQQVRLRRGIASHEAPVGPKTFTVSEDELNSFVENWQSPNKSQFQKWIKQYFTDCRLILEDGALMAAGESKPETTGLSTVISVEFDPAIDDKGKLKLELGTISAGRLPLPKSMFSGSMQQPHAWLAESVKANQPAATLDYAMVANQSAAAAEMSRLLLDSLDGNDSDSILFIPFDLGDLRQTLAVRISSIKIISGSMTMTLNPMGSGDQAPVLARIKRNYDPQAPGN
jgi:uncharacterized protein YpmS